MKIFQDWTFKWWEIALLKICLLSLGIILGLSFPDYLLQHITIFLVLFLMTTLYLVKMFLAKMWP